jgi:alpha-galactosidase
MPNPTKTHSSPPTMSTKRFLWFFLFSALLVFTSQWSIAGVDLNGAWRIDLVKSFGVTTHTFLLLHQEGSSLTGRAYPNGAMELPIRDAHLEGPDTVFRISWGWTFYVRPEGTKLRVVVVYGSGAKDEAVADPISESSLRQPTVLPIPALRELADMGLARTPPMGWNSWNHFAEAVDDATVRETADAMASSGMAAAGYVYVNIDDTWEGGRDTQGEIVPNRKFPDMKALADYVHQKGLKLGIYSSPGPVTCGGYEGSYGHEEQDAKTFAKWGIDYLKYDWCSASRVYSEAQLRAVYQKMGEALAHCGRPVVFSLCEYGGGDVWRWGPKVDGNLWRTTDDIRDNWKSMSGIGFEQGRLAPYASPGHWNDPDMLEVGNGGMTTVEYKTHFSLWCILAAPLMAGNDLRSMSKETRDILTNREVIAIDQDALGKQGTRLSAHGDVELWSKPLSGGGQAVGIFNRGASGTTASISWKQMGLESKPSGVRDLWHHTDLAVANSGLTAEVPSHGVVMLLVK